MKVYCSECEYFDVMDLRPDYYEETCVSPQNEFDSYIGKDTMKEPKEINKDNDCKYFKKEDECHK